MQRLAKRRILSKEWVVVTFLGLFSLVVKVGHAFTIPLPLSTRRCSALLVVGKDEEEVEVESGTIIPDFGEGDLQVAGVMIDDLTWRVEKLRLEEQNRRRFLKAKPRFLPYEECRKWVQAFNRWNTEKEWKSWIAMGEKRNSYIPSRPDEYYTYTGDWISWDHFFGVQSSGDTNDDNSDASSTK